MNVVLHEQILVVSRQHWAGIAGKELSLVEHHIIRCDQVMQVTQFEQGKHLETQGSGFRD